MIAKISKGRGFRGVLQYLLQNNRSKIVGGNMAGKNIRSLTTEFGYVRKMRESLGRAVTHISLSASPEDGLISDEDWVEIAERFMTELGYGRAAKVVVKHHDNDDPDEHQHIHIVACRVDFDGKTISDSGDFKKAESILRRIEKIYGFRIVDSPQHKKNEEITYDNKEMTMNENVKKIEEANDETIISSASCEIEFKDAKKRRDSQRLMLEIQGYESLVTDTFGDVVTRIQKGRRKGYILYFETPSRLWDLGTKIVAYDMAPQLAAERMVSLILERGDWISVTFTGTDEFVNYAIRAAIKNGLVVKPVGDKQVAMLERIVAEKDGRGDIGGAMSMKLQTQEGFRSRLAKFRSVSAKPFSEETDRRLMNP